MIREAGRPFLDTVNDVLTGSGVELPLEGQAITTMETRLEKGIHHGSDTEFLIRVVSQCLPYIGYLRSLNAIAWSTKLRKRVDTSAPNIFVRRSFREDGIPLWSESGTGCGTAAVWGNLYGGFFCVKVFCRLTDRDRKRKMSKNSNNLCLTDICVILLKIFIEK